MDINTELFDISENQKTPKEIIKELREKEAETAKKIHIFSVVDLINSIEEEMVKGKIFEKYGIDKIVLKYKYDTDADVNLLGFECYHSNGNKISAYDDRAKIQPSHDMLWRILRDFDDFTAGYVNQDFLKNKNAILNANEGIGEEIANILLTRELKAILDHGKLQNDLSKNGKNSKRMKV
jgi:hypothetical protein